MGPYYITIDIKIVGISTKRMSGIEHVSTYIDVGMGECTGHMTP